ncbi:membrane protein insertase YidC [Dongia deserti]|uniref:membrane protein insertase YidC n=1 Tax=Dongia deserti TaxID=2268030 RepID=UPI000E64C3D9|nr:membrane protein insertase YidC [Dongia deserti]
MENSKNVLLAIVLSAAIIILWTIFVQGPQMAKQQAQLEAQQAARQAQQAQEPAQQPGQAAPQDAGRKVVSREEALKEGPRVAIDTPRLKGSINLKGARLDDLVLKDYRVTIAPTSPNIVLLSPRDTEFAYYADFGWFSQSKDIVTPDKDTEWRADGTALAPGKPITLTWDNGQGLTFTRKFEVDADYMFTITDAVTNASGSPVEIAPYGRVVRYGTPQDATQMWVVHEGPIGVFDETLREQSYGDTRDEAEDGGKFTYTSTGGWMGISDKYWLVTQIPPQDESLTSSLFYDPKGDFYQVDFASAQQQVPAGGSATRTQHLFAGAKLVNMLEAYGEQLNLTKFDFAVDFGYFWFLTKPLFLILDRIFRFVGNFGLAILCLTVLVKAAMYPLANKSYRSMSKMKVLAPKMTELREKYGNDRTKLNQEMMELYKREKVNPAAGCLPILVQIPVFYALYKVLLVTIEMRHAPFFGWVKDLSAPDPTSILNLFGLIPWDYHVLFAIPLVGALFHILSIGVWPLIMGFTMWLQMRLNPTPPDPVQARIFGLMPIVFTFMLAPFAAGLVIYWAWNNTLSIAQQRLIMWRMGVKP